MIGPLKITPSLRRFLGVLDRLSEERRSVPSMRELCVELGFSINRIHELYASAERLALVKAPPHAGAGRARVLTDAGREVARFYRMDQASNLVEKGWVPTTANGSRGRMVGMFRRCFVSGSRERCGLEVLGGLKCTKDAGHEGAPRTCEWMAWTGSSGVGICRRDAIDTTPVLPKTIIKASSRSS